MKLKKLVSYMLLSAGIVVLLAGCLTASMGLIAPGVVAVVLGGFASMMANGS
jgi:hypothetical protein